jgi:hypothetical protein
MGMGDWERGEEGRQEEEWIKMEICKEMKEIVFMVLAYLITVL